MERKPKGKGKAKPTKSKQAQLLTSKKKEELSAVQETTDMGELIELSKSEHAQVRLKAV